jgi:hypothetical protein
MKIPVRITIRTSNLKVKKRPVTHLNLIEIPMNKKSLKNLAPVRIAKLPNFFLSNVRAICNKVDDLDLVLKMNEIDLAGITETWINSNILDSCVNIQGYNLVRNDRTEKRDGGICVFVKSSIPFVTLPNLGCPNHECLWVKLRLTDFQEKFHVLLFVCYTTHLLQIITNYMSTLLFLWTKYYYNTLEQESSSWATLTSLTLNVFAEIHLSNKLLRNQPVEKRLWI